MEPCIYQAKNSELAWLRFFNNVKVGSMTMQLI